MLYYHCFGELLVFFTCQGHSYSTIFLCFMFIFWTQFVIGLCPKLFSCLWMLSPLKVIIFPIQVVIVVQSLSVAGLSPHVCDPLLMGLLLCWCLGPAVGYCDGLRSALLATKHWCDASVSLLLCTTVFVFVFWWVYSWCVTALQLAGHLEWFFGEHGIFSFGRCFFGVTH